MKGTLGIVALRVRGARLSLAGRLQILLASILAGRPKAFLTPLRRHLRMERRAQLTSGLRQGAGTALQSGRYRLARTLPLMSLGGYLGALGWTSRYQAVRLTWKRATHASPWAVAAGVFVVAPPLIALLHEVAVLVSAHLLNWVSSTGLLEAWVRTYLSDEIYAGLALEMLGSAETYGLAMAGPIGGLLHYLWPSLFIGPENVPGGAWVSAVLASGTPLISQLLVVTLAEGLLMILGVFLAGHGLQGVELRSDPFGKVMINGRVLLGLLLQARSVLAIVTLELTQEDMEATGLAHIGTKVLLASREAYETDLLPQTTLLFLVLRVLLVAILYAIALLFARLVFTLPKLRTRNLASTIPGRNASRANAPRLVHLLPVVVVAALVSVSPSFGIAATNFSYGESTAVVAGAFDGPGVVGRGQPDVELEGKGDSDGREGVSSGPIVLVPPASGLVSPPAPGVVSVKGGSRNYSYEVSEKREVIRGVGYNVLYGKMPAEERARRYEQDFARMRDVGINTILGWDTDKGYDHDKFDDLLLAKANKYGLGVLMPYALPPNGEYASPEARASAQEKVIAWVKRFKDAPAVRMWAIGNEVFHGMSKKASPDVFADFYLKLADEVRRVDPNHPIVYRGAEDVYLRPLKSAWMKSKTDRPWLVIGMNIFTSRINRILKNWERQGFDAAVAVTEFGPSGLSPRDRPSALVSMWRAIDRHPCSVLGGIVYVWTTAGPEPIDRVFGLVDGNGVPVDGSLDAIATEFRRGVNPIRNCALSPKAPR